MCAHTRAHAHTRMHTYARTRRAPTALPKKLLKKVKEDSSMSTTGATPSSISFSKKANMELNLQGDVTLAGLSSVPAFTNSKRKPQLGLLPDYIVESRNTLESAIQAFKVRVDALKIMLGGKKGKHKGGDSNAVAVRCDLSYSPYNNRAAVSAIDAAETVQEKELSTTSTSVAADRSKLDTRAQRSVYWGGLVFQCACELYLGSWMVVAQGGE